MALIKCRECGHAVSTEATACPSCGARPRPARPVRSSSAKRVVIGFVAFVVLGYVAIVINAGGEGSSASTQKDPDVDFTRPLQTKARALVCPESVLYDMREGHGIQAAMNAFTDEAVNAAGCALFREGIPVTLEAEEQARASEWQRKHLCGMVNFQMGLVRSCNLRNEP